MDAVAATEGHNNGSVHDIYRAVHNIFVFLKICPGAGDDHDHDDCGAAEAVARVLGALGVATSSIATAATVYDRPPGVDVAGGSELAYLLAMDVLFLAGLAEVGAAFWVAADNRNRYGVEKIVRAALVLLVLVLAMVVGGFAVVSNI